MDKLVVMTEPELREMIQSAIRQEILNAMPNLKADAKEYPAHMSDIQAAEYLGIAPVTLRKWRADKIGPKYVKFEKTVRYSRKDLDAWLKSRAILTIDCTENVYEK